MTKENEQVQRVLLFYCQPQRDPLQLLKVVRNFSRGFDICVFTLMTSSRTQIKVGKEIQKSNLEEEQVKQLDKMVSAWKQLQVGEELQKQKVESITYLDESLQYLLQSFLKQEKAKMNVLVVGSLYLVGDVLKILGRQPYQS
eukprot:TRINITY_DN11322_c0_g1_i3.p2 TRINITY_DN11322_c0_g1~~TRINITY_DN11322_c0_g1_i3.p2  ORF type:complete len:157 (-),score=21.69 TRINITY_DN11322_c0_g1_i3:42-467(-)